MSEPLNTLNVKTQTGKQKTLVMWVETYSDQLYSWAYYKTKSKETAEDLVQETFLSVINSFDKCKDKEHPKTWIFTILNNKIIDFYRKSAKEWEKIDDFKTQESTKVVNELYDRDGNWKSNKLFNTDEVHLLDNPNFNSVFDACLNDLPENWRLAVLSKYVLNKSGKDICQELDISTSNYWQLIHRAKNLLRICIKKHWKE